MIEIVLIIICLLAISTIPFIMIFEIRSVFRNRKLNKSSQPHIEYDLMD